MSNSGNSAKHFKSMSNAGEVDVKTVGEITRSKYLKMIAQTAVQTMLTLYEGGKNVMSTRMMPSAKHPEFGSLMITKKMLDSAQESIAVSPEFLTFAAVKGSPIVAVFACTHVNTPPEALSHVIQNGNYDMVPSMAVYKALFNPHTPFKDVLVGWHKIDPEMILKDSPALADREEEYVELLAQHGLTVEEAEMLPPEWLIKTLFEGSA